MGDELVELNALVAIRRLPETNPAITGAADVVEMVDDVDRVPRRTGARIKRAAR